MAKNKQVKIGRQTSAEDQRLQEEQWRKLLNEQSRSGLTQREFCRRLSIPDHRFSWWKREIAKRDGRQPRQVKTKRQRRKPRASIVPVQIPTEGVHSTHLGEESSFEVVLRHGRLLRIPPQFDEETLARLLRLLEE